MSTENYQIKIAVLQNQMDNIEQKVDAGFTESNRQTKEVKDMLIAFIEKSEDRFAAKWVEKAIWSCAGIVGTAVIGSLMALILK